MADIWFLRLDNLTDAPKFPPPFLDVPFGVRSSFVKETLFVTTWNYELKFFGYY
jgi:hypothetical protein